MTKPPPALQEEWYVSIDGDQDGPFSLGDAQRWVAGKPFDAELHCWSEGFDDWLPVDKVSHFRGLRKRPAPAPAPRAAAPPSLPRAAEPRPRFAATMAQLEKAPAPRPLDPRIAAGARPSATPLNGQPPIGQPPRGMPAHANGAASLQARAGLPSLIAAPLQARVPLQPDASTKPPLRPFDASELADSSLTQLDAPPFESGDDATAPAYPDPGDEGDDGGSDDDDLDIGEVSRVVKLADLARDAGRHRPAGAQPPAVAATRTAAAARFDGPRPGELPPGPFANRPPISSDAAFFPPPLMAPPPAAVSHRRALIALIAGAIVLVGIAIGVVFFVLSDQEGSGSRLGTVEEIDTTRPDVVRPTGSGGARGAVTPDAPETPANPFVPRPRRPAITQPVTPPVIPEVGGTRLEAREIEEMAGKHSSTTQRCYMRAQRGADGILLGDVKKISVTLTVNGGGQVTDAQLSDNQAQNTLGRCLLAAIKSWRFRTSPGGTFRFVLHFG
jgi:hypothetical protein